MRTLVTAFGAFDRAPDNPSAHLAQGCGRTFEILEVAYVAADAFLETLAPERFDALLMLGVAVKRERMTPELFARNVKGEHPDVRGEAGPGVVEEGGPLLVESTLWTPAILAALEVSDNLRTSLDAGTYLCNYLAYRAIRRFPERRVGFLHVPPFGTIPQERQAAILQDVLTTLEG